MLTQRDALRDLATDLRPRNLNEVKGQEHLTGPGKPLRNMLEKGILKNTILWGPAGAGKTTICRILAEGSGREYRQLNATTMTAASLRASLVPGALIFLDECHRASKNIQDILLPHLEENDCVFFGATTETPRFAINRTILSRCHILEIKPVNEIASAELIKRAIIYYKDKDIIVKAEREVLKTLIMRSNGDIRKLYGVFQYLVESNESQGISSFGSEDLDDILPGKHVQFDSTGSSHYDFAHCYQDAIQNSDVNGAIYWLAAWLNSGEDPAYICRRMLISAFEDCATNPFAILSALAATLATERTGMPECMIPMAQATCELAKSERNKSAFYAIHAAMADVKNRKDVIIPPHMRAGRNEYERIISKEYVLDFVPLIDVIRGKDSRS